MGGSNARPAGDGLARLASCSPGLSEASVRLDEESSLSVGQMVRVEGEDLRMEFLEVVADSRCPKDVTCIWAGEVKCLVELVSSRSLERVELTQPGLTNEPSRQAIKGYELSFVVGPYPEEGKPISWDDYRLRLTVRKGVSLSGGILVTFDVAGEGQTHGAYWHFVNEGLLPRLSQATNVQKVQFRIKPDGLQELLLSNKGSATIQYRPPMGSREQAAAMPASYNSRASLLTEMRPRQ